MNANCLEAHESPASAPHSIHRPAPRRHAPLALANASMEPTRISDSTAMSPATTAIQKMDDTIDSGGSSSSSSSSSPPSALASSPTPAATPVRVS